MYKSKSKTELRHERIRGMLIANDLVTVSEFCRELGCSTATIRNDLRHLEENGLLKRSHGGAIATGKTAINSDMNMRSIAFRAEKIRIADYVVSNILNDGQTIILDAGSTCNELAYKIMDSDIELTVITNSLSAASLLSKSNRIKLYMAGGCFDQNSESFHDDFALPIFTSMRADICFISVNGVSLDAGLTISGHEESSVKKAMLNSAQRRIALADHSKIGKIGLKVICSLDEINEIICDTNDNNKEISGIKTAGYRIIFADQ